MSERNEADATLHIHAQPAWHDAPYIVGNRAALIALRAAIDEALATGYGGTADEMFAADGEGYDVEVRIVDGQCGDKRWNRRALPYTEEYAQETWAEAVWPWEEGETNA